VVRWGEAPRPPLSRKACGAVAPSPQGDAVGTTQAAAPPALQCAGEAGFGVLSFAAERQNGNACLI